MIQLQREINMTQKVMIQIFESDFNNDGLVQTVNARDLHEALEIGWDFSTWIERQLGDFKENQDFIIFHKKVEKSKGRPMKDYALTLDTAKHICMMARCEKGKQLRQYFIEVEKQYRLGYTAEPAAPQGLNTPQAALDAINAINSITQAALDAIKAIQQAAVMQPVIEQHTEPVKALPLVHQPCPGDEISLNKCSERFITNINVLKKMVELFGLESRMHDPVCVEGKPHMKQNPYPVFKKVEILSIVRALQYLGKPIGENNGREQCRIVFTNGRKRDFTIIKMVDPADYDGKLFDSAVAFLRLYLKP